MSPDRSPVHAFRKHATLVDFPGRLAALFFVSGCNFRCGFCHNAALLGTAREGISWERLREVCASFRGEWTDGAVISGGEPTLAPGLPALVALLREQGFGVKLDTNGSFPDVLESLLSGLDYVAMDIKCGPATYARLAGFAGVDRVRRSADLLRARARDYEFRTTVIEPVHTDEEMIEIGAMIRGARRYVLQPFIPRDDLPDAAFRSVPRTSPARLRHLAALMGEYAAEVICRD